MCDGQYAGVAQLLTVTPIGHLRRLRSIDQAAVLFDAQVIARRRHWSHRAVELDEI